MSKWNPRTPMPPAPAGFWRDIPNHPGYQASMDGEVRRVYPDGTVRILKPTARCGTHIEVNGKPTAHSTTRLVWSAFRGPVPQGKYVHHINGDKFDDNIYNLALADSPRSGKPNGRARQVAKIRVSDGEVVEIFPSIAAAAEELGLSRSIVSLAAKNGTYVSGGWRYMYAEDLTDRRRGRPRKMERLFAPRRCKE